MEASQLTLLSVADHVVEPANLFVDHAPAALAGRLPVLTAADDGSAHWMLDGVDLGRPAAGIRATPALGSADPDSGGPTGYEDLPRSFYDPVARLTAMDRNGVYAALSFPTMDAFAGNRLAAVPDAEAAAGVVAAYNDWQLDEWAATARGRLIPLCVLPAWDLDRAVAEVRRVAARGAHAISFPEMPYAADLPSFSTDHWDPLLRAVCDAGLVLCLRVARAAQLLDRPDDAPFNPFAAQEDLVAPQLAATACTDLVVSGVLNRFPDLRIAMSQGGIGWIPFLLDRIDLHLTNQTWSGLDLKGRSGTELFQEHFLACFVTDPSTLFLRNRIGIDCIAWQSAFPLTDSTWPNSPELLHGELTQAGTNDQETEAIAWRNAVRFFGLDDLLPPELASTTVASMRSRT
jgi:predicted TIM-barrel fold metal-dependent hydrolase